MPYREMDGSPCTACEQMTTEVCRNCQRPVCSQHAASYAFFVPVLECGPDLAPTCERAHGESPEKLRRELTRGRLGKTKRVPNEPC